MTTSLFVRSRVGISNRLRERCLPGLMIQGEIVLVEECLALFSPVEN